MLYFLVETPSVQKSSFTLFTSKMQLFFWCPPNYFFCLSWKYANNRQSVSIYYFRGIKSASFCTQLHKYWVRVHPIFQRLFLIYWLIVNPSCRCSNRYKLLISWYQLSITYIFQLIPGKSLQYSYRETIWPSHQFPHTSIKKY